MLTVFTVPKPFEGHIGMIQRNAIYSWTRLQPDCQVIICGNEPGSRAAAAKFGVDQIEQVELNEFGTPLLSSVFRLVEERATSELLCYVNADLILLSDFVDAARRVSAANQRFLMVGETWDVDVTREFAAQEDRWEIEVRRDAAQAGTVRPSAWVDYFVFPRGTIGPLPPFAVGRPAWDNWMIYRARSLRVPVVDVSPVTLVIHQHHDYRHVKQARGEQWEGPEGDRNVALLGLPERRSFSLTDATYELTPGGLARTTKSLKARVRTELLLTPTAGRLSQALARAYPLGRFGYRTLRQMRGSLLRRRGQPTEPRWFVDHIDQPSFSSEAKMLNSLGWLMRRIRRRGSELVDRMAYRLPPTLAGRLDLLKPSLRSPWGGPLNGQERRREIVRELGQVVGFDLVVETGTFRGTSTEFFATAFRTPIMTVESNPRYFAYSRRRLRHLRDVTVESGDSRRFLERLAADATLRQATVFIYLDAHWHEDLPLADELRIITRSWPRCVVMVDDFQVPGDAGYAYDDYGPGKSLDVAYLPTEALKGWSLSYPAANSDEETGAKRGCCVLASPGMAIDLVTLHRERTL